MWKIKKGFRQLGDNSGCPPFPSPPPGKRQTLIQLRIENLEHTLYLDNSYIRTFIGHPVSRQQLNAFMFYGHPVSTQQLNA